jgi:uncharacterized protein YjaG (DUF416 family)
MVEDLEVEFRASKRYRDAGESMSQDELFDRKQEIHWDVAWQIFDEVNHLNDLDRFIDLGALPLNDALAIAK